MRIFAWCVPTFVTWLAVVVAVAAIGEVVVDVQIGVATVDGNCDPANEN